MSKMSGSAVCCIESADDTLRELSASIELMRAGAEGLANGECMIDVMNHILKSLQMARAELDEAASVAAHMCASA